MYTNALFRSSPSLSISLLCLCICLLLFPVVSIFPFLFLSRHPQLSRLHHAQDWWQARHCASFSPSIGDCRSHGHKQTKPAIYSIRHLGADPFFTFFFSGGFKMFLCFPSRGSIHDVRLTVNLNQFYMKHKTIKLFLLTLLNYAKNRLKRISFETPGIFKVTFYSISDCTNW